MLDINKYFYSLDDRYINRSSNDRSERNYSYSNRTSKKILISDQNKLSLKYFFTKTVVLVKIILTVVLLSDYLKVCNNLELLSNGYSPLSKLVFLFYIELMFHCILLMFEYWYFKTVFSFMWLIMQSIDAAKIYSLYMLQTNSKSIVNEYVIALVGSMPVSSADIILVLNVCNIIKLFFCLLNALSSLKIMVAFCYLLVFLINDEESGIHRFIERNTSLVYQKFFPYTKRGTTTLLISMFAAMYIIFSRVISPSMKGRHEMFNVLIALCFLSSERYEDVDAVDRFARSINFFKKYFATSQKNVFSTEYLNLYERDIMLFLPVLFVVSSVMIGQGDIVINIFSLKHFMEYVKLNFFDENEKRINYILFFVEIFLPIILHWTLSFFAILLRMMGERLRVLYFFRYTPASLLLIVTAHTKMFSGLMEKEYTLMQFLFLILVQTGVFIENLRFV